MDNRSSAPNHLSNSTYRVNASVFQRTHSYQPWDQQTACRIFTCGRLNFCKGHADLIEAIALLRQQGVPATLEIAGEDEQGGIGYRKELESLIQWLNLADSVRLLGATSEQTIKNALENAHIFALASLLGTARSCHHGGDGNGSTRYRDLFGGRERADRTGCGWFIS